MVLFFAAIAVNLFIPGSSVSRACVGGFMFAAASLVVWCMWATKERTQFWWFQPDPDQVELDETEEYADDSSGFPRNWRDSIRRVPLFRSSRPTDTESRAMQEPVVQGQTEAGTLVLHLAPQPSSS